jgi:hypothetical protein
MTEDSILTACATGFVPCNAAVGAALDAHRTAWRWQLEAPTERGAKLAGFALHAVMHAAPKSLREGNDLLSYFSGLPFEAWRCMSIGRQSTAPDAYRDYCIKDASRNLEWLQ